MDDRKDGVRTPLLEVVKPEVKQSVKTAVYTRRWYMLALYSFVCFCQALVWNTWGPITQSAKVVFKWEDSNIGMLANWGNIAYIFTVFPACYLMDVKGTFKYAGLRRSLLGCCLLMFLGTGIRCITSHPDYTLWTMNAGAVLNGVAGTVPFAGPPLLAALWFPPDQRATATATSSVFNYGGVAVAFIFGPQLVSSPHYRYETDNRTELSLTLTTEATINRTVLTNFDTLESEIMRLMYIECGYAGLLLLLVLIYFPDKPALPPSTTASMERIEYKKALLKMSKNGNLWLIALAYAVPAGVYGVYGSVFDVILNPVGVAQSEAGWIGFYSTIAGCASGLVIARFADMFMKHMKVFLIGLFILATGSFVWLTLLCNQTIPFSIVQLYASSIMGGMFLNGCIPLFYELACEASYPVSEGLAGGFMTWLNNLFGILFLLALLIPGIGTAWMNFCLVGSVGLGLLVLFVFPEKYTRTDIDITVTADGTMDVQTSVHQVTTTYT
ncbi:disrupted in renal carcinoma protein 2 homolog isoform X2 [Mizuhopecten yessoensis]|uniref:disrupted in renal carcinoma protein 2 homolog isoform X2 n=1 Tax=Mizuhopecten yessoensis TaxID=6573 RepID=UPI000B45EE26|nr:disrupted in renal carcinoma protein 2 homolog isoform X2 [Mizuhopecten yessoensis]